MSEYRIFYSPYYYADIGEGHVFPIRKFEIAKDILLAEGTLTTDGIVPPEAFRIAHPPLVHTRG